MAAYSVQLSFSSIKPLRYERFSSESFLNISSCSDCEELTGIYFAYLKKNNIVYVVP